jgi:nitrite reductase (NADH) small subunit
MSEFTPVMTASELPVGRVKACVVDGKTIAVYHTASGGFATDHTWPHRGGPLAEGDLIGDESTCPGHLWGFDIATGLCAGNPDIKVAAHEVRVEVVRVLV